MDSLRRLRTQSTFVIPQLEDPLKPIRSWVESYTKRWKQAARPFAEWVQNFEAGEYARFIADAQDGTWSLEIVPSSDDWLFTIDASERIGKNGSWRTEAILARIDETWHFSFKIIGEGSAAAAVLPERLFEPLRAILDEHRASDAGQAVSDRPRAITTDTEVSGMAATIRREDRHMPAVVVSEPWHVDVPMLARTLYGIAHVYAIREQQTYRLSDEFGKHLSAFNGYARVYGVPFRDGDTGFKHPGATENRLMQGDGFGHLVDLVTNVSRNLPDLVEDADERVKPLQVHGIEAKTPPKSPAITPKPRPTASPIETAVVNVADEFHLDPEEIAAIVRDARLRLGLTQMEVAKRSGVIQSGVSRVERGLKSNPESIALIARALDIDLADFERKPSNGVPAAVQETREETDAGDRDVARTAAQAPPDQADKSIAGEGPGASALTRRITALEELAESQRLQIEQLLARIAALEERSTASKVVGPTVARQTIKESGVPAIQHNDDGTVTIPSVMFREFVESAKLVIEIVGAEAPATATLAEDEPTLPFDEAAAAAAEETEADAAARVTERVYPSSLNLEEFTPFVASLEHIEVHSRAVRALKKSVYARPDRLYAALDILNREYTQMRTNQTGYSPEIINAQLSAIGLRLKSIASWHHNDNYIVEWQGQKRRITHEVCSKSSPVDPTRTLRIYFFWDEEREKIVLCWLPSHLPVNQAVS